MAKDLTNQPSLDMTVMMHTAMADRIIDTLRSYVVSPSPLRATIIVGHLASDGERCSLGKERDFGDAGRATGKQL